jgi:hypothetical protein
MNPYESPPQMNWPKLLSWRLIRLLPAVLLFAVAHYSMLHQLAVVERARTSAVPLPPTMYTQHVGLAVGAIALGLAFTIAALRERGGTDAI